MYLMYPVAYPTALLLDYILGEDHGTVYKKAGLKTLVTLHKSLGPHPSERLNQDEVTIISAVLDLKEKPVGSIMTPIKDVFTMSSDTVLDEDTMDEILSAGYSRIPIHAPGEPTNFVGMLLVKVLITYDPEDAKQVHEFPLATLPETAEDTSCLDIVNFFQEGKSHMVLVSEYPGENRGALGVVTLEDVIEELIGEEIVDESDVYIDVHKAIRRLNPSPLTLSSSTKRNISAHYVARTADAQALAKTASAVAQASHPDESTDLLITTGPAEPVLRQGTPAHIDEASPMNRARKHSATRVPGLSDEVIAHLTLGPANLADRPRETTSKTVKIKQMDPSRRSDDAFRPFRNQQQQQLDGTAASPGRALIKLDVNAGPGNTSGNVEEGRTLGAPQGYRKKARTGSLIERTDVVDGIPKTVIETTSSSEDDGTQDDARSIGSNRSSRRHRKTPSCEMSPLLGPKK
jgi:metal transporter CNNM